MHLMRENKWHNISCHTKNTQQKNFIFLYCVILLAHSSTCKNQHDKNPPLNVRVQNNIQFCQCQEMPAFSYCLYKFFPLVKNCQRRLACRTITIFCTGRLTFFRTGNLFLRIFLTAKYFYSGFRTCKSD